MWFMNNCHGTSTAYQAFCDDTGCLQIFVANGLQCTLIHLSYIVMDLILFQTGVAKMM